MALTYGDEVGLRATRCYSKQRSALGKRALVILLADSRFKAGFHRRRYFHARLALLRVPAAPDASCSALSAERQTEIPACLETRRLSVPLFPPYLPLPLGLPPPAPSPGRPAFSTARRGARGGEGRGKKALARQSFPT